MKIHNQTVSPTVLIANATALADELVDEFNAWLLGWTLVTVLAFVFVVLRVTMWSCIERRVKKEAARWRGRREEAFHERARRSIPQQPIPASQFISYVDFKRKEGFFQYELNYVNESYLIVGAPRRRQNENGIARVAYSRDDANEADDEKAAPSDGDSSDNGGFDKRKDTKLGEDPTTSSSSNAKRSHDDDDDAADSKNLDPVYLDGFLRQNFYLFYDGPYRDVDVGLFWRVVWSEKIPVIVLLSTLSVLRKGQYIRYWRTLDSTRQITGSLSVTTIAEETFAFFTKRTFLLKMEKDGEEREEEEDEPSTRRVVQFQLNRDADENSFIDPIILLDFRRFVKTFVVSFGGPILVHSARDLGATGLFVAIDALLDFVVATQKVDVARYVKYLNRSVPGSGKLISSQIIYEFLHDVISLRILIGCTSSRIGQFKRIHDQLGKLNPWTRMTGLQQEFKTLSLPSVKRKFGHADTAICLQPRNFNFKMRDRFVRIPDEFRVRLNTVASEKLINDFVNAVYIPGYRSSRAQIVTPWPLEDTLEDFWKMVFDTRTSSVVVLNDTPKEDESSRKNAEESFPVFWPGSGGGGDENKRRVAFGQMHVEEIEREITESVVTRTLRVSRGGSSLRSISSLAERVQSAMKTASEELTRPSFQEQNRQLRIFQFLSWPSEGRTTYDLSLHHLLQLQLDIRTWERFNRNSLESKDGGGTEFPRLDDEAAACGDDAPIIIVSKDGVERVGVFCTINVLDERILAEETVDVFQTVRLIRMRRPELIVNPAEYNMCYDFVRRKTEIIKKRETIC